MNKALDNLHKKILNSKLAEEVTETEIESLVEAKNNGWIPCSERLPDTEDDVLVWYEYYRYGSYNRLYQTYGISYMYDGKWSNFVNGQSGWHQLRIIAWQPLPAQYKEGGM